MSFRILNQAPQYLLADGSVNAGGKLWFYETDLTTPQNTWSDEALSVLNSNPVVMDAAGRTLTDVWGGDFEYGVKMTDADDVVIWTRNNVRATDTPGAVIPALVDGQFLTNNGSVLLWDDILQVPDPEGFTDYVLKSDGVLAFWGALPDLTPPDPEIVVGVGSFRAGVSTDETKFLVQYGSGTADASGTLETTEAIVFTTAYATTPTVLLLNKGGGAPSNAGNVFPRSSTTAVSTTGFTAAFSTRTGGSSADLSGNGNLTGSIAFDWVAFGTVEVPP